MRRWLARAAWLIGACLGALVILAAAIAWRLAAGPIELPWLTGRLERALASRDGALTVRIGGTELAWDRRKHAVNLLVRNVVVASGGETVAHLPAASLEFGARALLTGRLVLRGLELPDPRLTLRENAGGAWQVALGTDAGGAAKLKTLLAEAVRPDPEGPLAELRHVTISGASVVAAPGGDAPGWALGDADLMLRMQPDAITVDGGGTLAVADRRRSLDWTGRIDLGSPACVFDLTLTGGELAIAELRDLWPAAVAASVRTWVVQRVRGGQLSDSGIDLHGRLFDDPGGATLETVTGHVDFAGLQVQPVDGAPPITDVAGRATLDRDRCRFDVTRARIAGLDLVRGTTDVTGLRSDAPGIEIRVRARGPLDDALAVAGRYGGTTIEVMGATGRVEAALDLAWTLGRRGAAMTRLGVKGNLREVVVPRIGGGHALRDGAFTFDLARGALAMRGAARIDGVPVDLALAETLGEPRRRIDVTARLDAADRAALGVDLRPWVEGPIPIRGSVTLDGDRASGRVSADLQDATLAAPAVGIAKAAGLPGAADARFAAARGHVTAVDGASLGYGATRLRGDATLSSAGAIDTLHVAGTLGATSGRAAPATIELDLARSGAGRTLVATADSVDLLFDALGMAADATGGRARFDGAVAPAPGFAVDGVVEARDFRLTRAPLMARLIGMMSLPGLKNVMDENGMAVTSVTAHLAYRTPRLAIEDGTFDSPSLGMRFAGTVDTASGRLDVDGTLAPSYYGLNTLAGHVPVLGKLLTGPQDQGIQAFAFTVRGTASDPEVRLDAIASLGPGAARDLLRHLPRPTLPRLRP